MKQIIPRLKSAPAVLLTSANMTDSKNKTSMLETSMGVIVPFIEEQLSVGGKVKFSPRGVSMLPMLRQGRDSVIFSPVPERLKKYDLPLYRRDNGKYILHRIVGAGERYTCCGDNQYDYEYGLRHEQMIALVTGFTRGDKEHSVDEFAYKLYCRLWHYSRPVRCFLHRGLGWLRRHLR